ncbi:carbonic anhydrase 4 isoform X1 [Patella vulgata]|uniref:carbonic anhydrase 4 isoform X1 n=1 Tax=Patella vulgata TaxID=6465 RepID=UPI0021800B33|nr:carbonic anhydrase 4 isoform X1 [Patella vulgata]
MELSVAFTFLTFVGLSTAALWGYEDSGPSKWAETFPTCGDKSQSPINIEASDSTLQASLGNMTMTGYDTPVALTIKNNGHTAQVDVTGDQYISKGGLSEQYKLVQFHFHWGSDDMKGSEHQLNSKTFPMEVHFVHYKNSLGSLGNSVGEKDGLAVLGFMFEISDSDNANYADLISKLSNITAYNTSNLVNLTNTALMKFIPSKPTNFFRYSGSLTTPSCNEVVVWTVFTETIKISKTQMATFRSLMSSETGPKNEHYHIKDNFRPVQPLHSRSVFNNFYSSSATTAYITVYTGVLSLILSTILSH